MKQRRNGHPDLLKGHSQQRVSSLQHHNDILLAAMGAAGSGSSNLMASSAACLQLHHTGVSHSDTGLWSVTKGAVMCHHHRGWGRRGQGVCLLASLPARPCCRHRSTTQHVGVLLHTLPACGVQGNKSFDGDHLLLSDGNPRPRKHNNIVSRRASYITTPLTVLRQPKGSGLAEFRAARFCIGKLLLWTSLSTL